MKSCCGCGMKEATLICPSCKELGLTSLFCGQQCFKANWKTHKEKHRRLTFPVACSIPRCETQIGIDGVKVETHHELGRILVASRPFASGDIVLEEAPFCKFQGSIGFIMQYASMSDSQKELLMEFQHVSSLQEIQHSDFHELLSEQLQEKITNDEFCAVIGKYDVDEVTQLRLLSLMLINSHMFNDETGIPFGALFYTASKMSHDCHPNCSYSSKTLRNHLVYFANRDIAEGEILSFSYIEKDHLPTSERRKILRKTKNFFCNCTKCTSVDLANGYKCVTPGCLGIVYSTPSTSGGGDFSWCCNSCDSRVKPEEIILEAETVYRKFLKFKQDTVEIAPDTPDQIRTLKNDLTLLVGPFSYMLIEIEEYLVQVFDVVITSWEEVCNPRKSKEAREMALSMLFGLTKRIECLNHKCTVGTGCLLQHAPQSSCANYMLWAALHLIKGRQDLPLMIIEYIPMFILCFGIDDIDVQSIIRSSNKGQSSSSL